jgi:hypothetical protein
MKPILFFVTARAWQLFILFIAPLIIGTLLSALVKSMVAVQIGEFIGIWMVLLWIYSVCTFIYEKYSVNLTIPINKFKLCILFGLIYSVFFCFGFIPLENLGFFHIIAISVEIYCLYFLAKLLIMAEKKSAVKFRDYIGTFFAAYVLIIGIWWLQPRINRITLIPI